MSFAPVSSVFFLSSDQTRPVAVVLRLSPLYCKQKLRSSCGALHLTSTGHDGSASRIYMLLRPARHLMSLFYGHHQRGFQ